jgi:uncharacterized protein
VRFEWDAQKAASNLREHRVSFPDAVTVFADPLARIHADPDHSVGESREIIIGQAANGQLLLVSFVEREDSVRLISARRATRRERHEYEKAIKQA